MTDAPAGKVVVIEPRIRLVAFDEIRLGTQRRYLIKGLIPLIGIIVLWGSYKSGKSFWLFDALLHVALNWQYRGRRVHHGAVVYCAFEGQTGIEARKEAFAQKFLSDDRDLLPFYLQAATLDLIKDKAELIAAIRARLGDVRPAAIALDTLNRSLRGSESSDEDMSNYVQAADALREAFQCAIIVVHHCGYDQTHARGHTALIGAADAELSVKRDVADNVVVTVECAKDGPAGDTIVSRLEVVEVGVDDDGEPITSCVVVPAEAAAASATDRVKGAAKVALDALQEAIAEVGEAAPASNHIPPGSRTTHIDTWRRYCDAKMIAESGKPDTKRKAFVRASLRLQELGIIGVWTDYVWLAGQAGQ